MSARRSKVHTPWWAALTIVFCLALTVVLGLRGLPVVSSWEAGLLERRIRQTQGTVKDEIVLVLIQKDTLRKLGSEEALVPRRYYGKLIDGLSAAGARVLLINLFFPDRSLGADGAMNEDDVALKTAIAAAPPLAITLGAGDAGEPTADADEVSGYRYRFERPFLAPRGDTSELTVGHRQVWRNDNVVRGLQPILSDETTGNSIGHVSFCAALQWLGLAPAKVQLDDRLTLRYGDRKLGLLDRAQMLIPFRAASHRKVEFADALNSLADATQASRFRGKLVILGRAEEPDLPTTIGPLDPAEVVAQAAERLIDGARVPPFAGPVLALLWSLLASVPAVLGYCRHHLVPALIGLGLSIGLIAWIPVVVVQAASVSLDTVIPSVVLGLSYLVVSLVESSRLGEALRQSLPPWLRSAWGLKGPELVTVMFADMKSSTEFGAALDHETFRRILIQVNQRMSATVEAHGGQVMRIMGDGVLATFRLGTPRQQAERCLRCAAELIRAFPDLDEELRSMTGKRFAMTFGLEAGEVSAKVIEGQEFSELVMYGVTIHLAARLQGACGSLNETIIMGPEVAREVDGWIPMRVLPAQSLKGFPNPVPVFAPDLRALGG